MADYEDYDGGFDDDEGVGVFDDVNDEDVELVGIDEDDMSDFSDIGKIDDKLLDDKLLDVDDPDDTFDSDDSDDDSEVFESDSDNVIITEDKKTDVYDGMLLDGVNGRFKAKKVWVQIKYENIKPFNLQDEIDKYEKYLDWSRKIKEMPCIDWSNHPGAPRQPRPKFMKGERVVNWVEEFNNYDKKAKQVSINFMRKKQELVKKRSQGIL